MFYPTDFMTPLHSPQHSAPFMSLGSASILCIQSLTFLFDDRLLQLSGELLPVLLVSSSPLVTFSIPSLSPPLPSSLPAIPLPWDGEHTHSCMWQRCEVNSDFAP